MGFSKWFLKKTAIGGAARLMIKAYRKQKALTPNASDREIFEAIARWRYGLTGERLEPEDLDEMIHCGSLRDFVKKIVVAERWKDLRDGSHAALKASVPLDVISSIRTRLLISNIYDVIDEICDEAGL